MEVAERQICVMLECYGFENELDDYVDPNTTRLDCRNWTAPLVALVECFQHMDVVMNQTLQALPAKEDVALEEFDNSPEEDKARSWNGDTLSIMAWVVSEQASLPQVVADSSELLLWALWAVNEKILILVGVLVQDCTQVVAVYYSVYALRENAQVDCWSLGCGNLDDLAAKCMGHHHVRQAAAALRLQKKPLVDTAALRWENSRQGRYFFVHGDLKLECRTMKDSHSPAGAPGTSLDSVLLVRMRYLTEVGHSLAGTLASPGVIEDADISTQNLVRSLDALEEVVAVREQQAVVVAMNPREQARYIH